MLNFLSLFFSPSSSHTSPKATSKMTPEEARMRAYALVGHEDIMLEWIDREGIESQGIGWYVWNNLDLQAGCIFVGR